MGNRPITETIKSTALAAFAPADAASVGYGEK